MRVGELTHRRPVFMTIVVTCQAGWLPFLPVLVWLRFCASPCLFRALPGVLRTLLSQLCRWIAWHFHYHRITLWLPDSALCCLRVTRAGNLICTR